MFFQKKSLFPTISISFAVGALTGAVVALIFTPFTGKKFQQKVVDVTEKVIDKVDDLQQSVRKFANA